MTMKELTAEVELFREFTEPEMDKVRAIADLRDYAAGDLVLKQGDRKSTRLNSSHSRASRMPSSA